MVKEFKVFFSWQSDLPSNQTKKFIEDCIDVAKNNMPDSISLIPDEATRNRFGSPDIMDSIYDKINECDLFIADVSIVGSYISQRNIDDDDPEVKYFSNPNVLLELGYASGTISWERCICLANTNYGELGMLPFDLNHRRVTGYFYGEGGRKAEINRIADIIKSTILEYVDKPLPKKNFSHHIVGGFNFELDTVEQKIIPFNEISFRIYNEHTQRMLDEAKTLVEKISEIHLPPMQEEEDFDAITKDMTVSDIMKDPILSKSFSLKLTKARPVKVDKEFISEHIKKYFECELAEDFFNVGNLKECTPLVPFNNSSLEGTDFEKAKYELLQNLECKLSKIDLREMYLHLYDDVVIIPLAIMNCSQKNDERLAINIKIIEGTPIKPTSNFFNSDFKGMEGFVYDEHLVQELLKLPENSIIKFDSSFTRDAVEQYITHYSQPIINSYGCISEPESDAEDYEQELQDYVQNIDDGTCNEYSFTIGALRPKEIVWLDKVLLIKPIDGKIIIEYSIKSNNTTGDLMGRLSYEVE